MRAKGYLGEDIAQAYLEAQGLVTRERNYRTHYGEIDLIMQDGDVLVFIEVKYRQSSNYGNPLEAVTWRKQQTIKRVARCYIQTLGYEPQCRFDVIGIVETRIYWVRGAFT